MAKGICYGTTDLGVASSFENEVATVLAGLPTPRMILSSPLQRCRVLADRVAKASGVDFQILDDLREMDFGRWEMVPWNDIPRSQLDEWAADFLGARPHDGESVQQLRDRVSKTLSQVEHDTLVVTHSGVIRAAAALFDHPDGWDIDIKYGNWITLTAD